MLPDFHPTQREQHWLEGEERTAKAIRLLWQYASPKDRRDAGFLGVLVRCSWVNGSQGADEANRKWRNREIAAWLGLSSKASDKDLAAKLSAKLGMPLRNATWIIRSRLGFTAYYKSLRPTFWKQFSRYIKPIGVAFAEVAKTGGDSEEKVRGVSTSLFNLPSFSTPNGGQTLFVNALSAALACVDPQLRFPVINTRTRPLLRTLGQAADVDGAVALSRLIGSHGIKSSLYLDVYSQVRAAGLKPLLRKTARSRTMERKSEEESYVFLAAQERVIRKRHNELTNKFMRQIGGAILEQRYDCLISSWRRGRRLLIEAKTETHGSLGRTQLRQAIGQLFDYRRDLTGKVDLAILTPTRPDDDALDLLASVGIKALWFDGNKLGGTVNMPGRN